MPHLPSVYRLSALFFFFFALMTACQPPPPPVCTLDKPFLCGDTCVRILDDPKNCGACSRACDQGQRCENGECRCDGGRVNCDGRCVDLRSSPSHCGACGTACQSGQFCAAGECVAACPADTPQECERACIDTQRDAFHCGACNNACAEGQICREGACRCPADLTSCGGACVDTLSSLNHCGACGQSCPEGQRCSGGVCVTSCPAPTPASCFGGCVDLQSNRLHCGACGQICPSGQICEGSRCVCPSELTLCAGRCVSLLSDRLHCGACGEACGNGRICAFGECVTSCPEATPAACYGGCVNTQDNLLHCGACGQSCASGERCVAGQCVISCPTRQIVCNRQCVDTARDALHCGACGQRCAVGERCEEGRCVIDSLWLYTAAGPDLTNLNQSNDPKRALLFSPFGLALDDNGDLYVSDAGNARILRLETSGRVTNIAGKAGVTGFNDAVGEDARFNIPASIAFGPDKALYVVDLQNRRIRRIDRNGQVTTVAGSGQQGATNGTALAASFGNPVGLAWRGNDLYITDFINQTIRLLSNGNLTTAAGTGRRGSADGPALQAEFTGPFGMAERGGDLYIVDMPLHRLRVLRASGQVETLAGGGKGGYQDGPALQAEFLSPQGVAPGNQGEIYIMDTNNRRIRKLQGGQVTTVAGTGRQEVSDGPALQASFLLPVTGLVDPQGNLYIADGDANRVRKLDPQGNVTTVLGLQLEGFADGAPFDALFNNPRGLALGLSGELYIADEQNHRIRRLNPQGTVSTIAGNGSAGKADGDIQTGRLSRPHAVAIHPTTREIYIADTGNYSIRKITREGQLLTVAGSGEEGDADGSALQARFRNPVALAFSPTGDLFISDQGAHRIRLLDAAGTTVSTIAGNGSPAFIDHADPRQAAFNSPAGLAFDNAGNLYIADEKNHSIRRLTAQKQVETVVGRAIAGYADGPVASASLRNPTALAFDPAGNLYFADTGNDRIRRLTLRGEIQTVAGAGAAAASNAFEGPALQARIGAPLGLAIDRNGILFLSDALQHRICRLAP